MEVQPPLGNETRPTIASPHTLKDEMTVNPLQPQIHKRKCRRFFHLLIIAALLGLVLWIRHGEAIIGAMLRVEAFFSEGGGVHDLNLNHPIHIPGGITLLKCTNWDGQDDLPPSSDTPYPLPLDSLSSLFPPGNPSDVNRGGCDPRFHGRPQSKDKGRIGPGSAELRMRRFTSSADFVFPLNKTQYGEENKFFFISRGRWSAGRVNVFQRGLHSLHGTAKEALTTPETVNDGGGEVKIHVDIGYLRQEYLDYVKVCKISVNTGIDREDAKLATGVGIFTPDVHRGPHDHAEPFYVTIEFPEASSSSKDAKSKPITITELISDMPLFSQNFGDLRRVYFEKLVVTSVNQPLKSVSVWGGNLIFSTVNAAITGTFKALKAVILVTKNAPIEVDIELVQTPDAVDSTIADLATANGRIIANTTLTSTSEEGTGGNFTVGLATVKAPITLTFPSAPTNHTLYLGASTLLSPVNIALHPTYEGSFSFKTLLASATLNAKRDPEGDPEDKGRQRGLDVLVRGYGKMEGATWWDEERKWNGHVKVESTLSPVVLAL